MTTKRWFVAAALVIVAIAAVWVWSSRNQSEESSEPAGEGVVPAAVTRVMRRDLGSTLTISGAIGGAGAAGSAGTNGTVTINFI